MRIIPVLLLIMACVSCASKKNVISVDNIKSVHVLYERNDTDKYYEYTLYDGTHLRWSRDFTPEKAALQNYEAKLDSLPQKRATYLESFMAGREIIRFYPIKTKPLKEFGYVKTKENKVLYYGIMDDSTLLNFSNKTIYARLQ